MCNVYEMSEIGRVTWVKCRGYSEPCMYVDETLGSENVGVDPYPEK